MSGEINDMTWEIRMPTKAELAGFEKKRQEKALIKQCAQNKEYNIFVLRMLND